jgi:hypothetical protein
VGPQPVCEVNPESELPVAGSREDGNGLLGGGSDQLFSSQLGPVAFQPGSSGVSGIPRLVGKPRCRLAMRNRHNI